jgi:hypothetical protein
MLIRKPPTTIKSEQIRAMIEYARDISYEVLKVEMRAQVTLLQRLYSQ